ncbi:MAG: c-type cytochrome domain-containing protein [Candidatus Halalkalibacterium sp. M3_1C_030]
MKKLTSGIDKENSHRLWNNLFQPWLTRSFLLMLLVTFISCGGGSSTGPEPDPDPDPDPNPDRPVSFSEDIQPIFNGNCAVSGCHDSGTQESGVDLSSYDAALNSIGVQYGTEIIQPGDPNNSPIVDKISNDDPEFGQRMPFNRQPLSEAEIDSIIAWIEDDAPNN